MQLFVPFKRIPVVKIKSIDTVYLAVGLIYGKKSSLFAQKCVY